MEVTTPGVGTVVTTDFSLGANDSDFIHSIGPRLAVEIDVGRLGPLGLAPWVAVQARWRLGNRKLDAAASDGVNSAIFEQELSAEAVHGAIGIRLYWARD